MTKKCFLLLLAFTLVSCQLTARKTSPIQPEPAQANLVTEPAATLPTSQTPTLSATRKVITPQAGTTPAGGVVLSPITLDLISPFTGYITLASWEPKPYSGIDYALPVNLQEVDNPHVLDGLTPTELQFLSENGFLIVHSQESDFGDLRERVSHYYGQTYFLTVDAAYHALHLTFDETLKTLEQVSVRPKIISLIETVLDETLSYIPLVKGTFIEEDTHLAAVYLGVALKLFSPQATVDPLITDLVSQQVDQIMAGGGKAYSVSFRDFEDDYGAYKPVGHYAGNPDLEAYFRGMTWLGRVHFPLKSAENPNFTPSRLPLIITLAMRTTQINGGQAVDEWVNIYKLLNLLIGATDDAGPFEYSILMDQVYGNNQSIQTLVDDQKWAEFLQQSETLPAPQINSTFVASTADITVEKGWRFMGQRFTMDAFIFQNLISDKVKPRGSEKRMFPSGLDVMAVFGSKTAMQLLTDLGETTYPNYLDQMGMLQNAVQEQSESQWLSRVYDTWLYSFIPVLSPKDDTYPVYMRNPIWEYKDMNAVLGSWAELKHDTALYTKMPEFAGGGGPPASGPAPAYVEPNPQAYYRIAYLTRSLAQGLLNRLSGDELDVVPPGQLSLGNCLYRMDKLGNMFQAIGDISVKELAGEPLTQDDYYLIQGCLGLQECEKAVDYGGAGVEVPPPPVIAAVSGAENEVLEVGVGYVDRIFVLIPGPLGLSVAQGGVFSYYEFRQPRDNRLTDEEWRNMLASSKPPTLPVWATNFVFFNGKPTDWLAFRVGDIYIITQAGDKLNVRASPSKNAQIVTQFMTGDYVEIIGGPIVADGYTWWNVKKYNTGSTGWAVENQEWYERAHGQ